MTLSFITVIKLKFQDASTKVQESFFIKLKSQYRYQKLNYLNTLAVIPNQYLINRKGGSRRNVKPRIPPHPTAKQGILFLRRMGYPALKKMKQISIEIIHKCPNRCLHCSSNSDINCTLKIETAEVKKIIDSASKLNTEVLSISGGEPFLHDGLLEIVHYAKSKGIKVYIYTSGIILNIAGRVDSIQQELLQQLSEWRVKPRPILMRIA